MLAKGELRMARHVTAYPCGHQISSASPRTPVGIKYLRLHCVASLLVQLEFNLIATLLVQLEFNLIAKRAQHCGGPWECDPDYLARCASLKMAYYAACSRSSEEISFELAKGMCLSSRLPWYLTSLALANGISPNSSSEISLSINCLNLEPVFILTTS